MKTKVKGQCWENTMAKQAKPELSTGTPEELTPNQLAELEASRAALSALQQNDLQIERGWRLLAAHVGLKPKHREPDFVPFSAEEDKAWGSGFKTGINDLEQECPETDPHLKSLWNDGFNSGFKALIELERADDCKRGKIQRRAKEVTDLNEMEKIWKMYKGNGGKMTFEQIEAERSNGLKWTNGMTAYRICKKFDKIRRNKQVAA